MNPRVIGTLAFLAVLVLGGGWLLTRKGTPRERAPTGDATTTPAAPIALPPLPAVLPEAPELQRAQLQPDGSLGQPVNLAEFRSQKAVLVNFWATWCLPCEKEIPDFAQVAQEFSNDVAIILVNRSEPRDAQAKYLLDRSLATGTLLTFLDDPDDSAYRAFGGYGMPVTAFITKGGRIAGIKSGLMTLEEMRARIQQLLSAP